MKNYFLTLLSLILAVSLYLPNNTNAKSIFNDVPANHSNYNDIMYLVDTGVISADTTTFGVKNIVTREEVAVMIAKAIGLKDSTPRETKFSDVPASNKNSGYIQSAVEAGIINGYGDGTFKPQQKVTRGHMAAFIARAFELPNGNKTFKDVPKGHTAYDAVGQLAEAGITTGYGDGTFKPKDNLTRAHISAFLTRAMKFEKIETSVNKVEYVLDIKEIIKEGNSIDDFTKQRELLSIEKNNFTQLLKDEQRKLNSLLHEKEAIELEVLEIRKKLDFIHSQVTEQRTVISSLNQEIKDYRKNNKSLLVTQKAKYTKELETLQTQYAQVQTNTTTLINERTQIENVYTNIKNKLNLTRNAITISKEKIVLQKDALRKIETAIETVNKKSEEIKVAQNHNNQQNYQNDSKQTSNEDKDTTRDGTKIDLLNDPYLVDLDYLTEDEKELALLINEYRESLGLKPFTVSKSLTFVARSHVIDSNKYSPENGVDSRGLDCNLHSWSENGSWSAVCYTGDHNYSQQMWDKPKELTSYQGNGYEISAYGSGGMSAATALNLWKNSPGHNNVIVGNGSWSDLTVMGIGINGNYAHVWFGEEADNAPAIQ